MEENKNVKKNKDNKFKSFVLGTCMALGVVGVGFVGFYINDQIAYSRATQESEYFYFQGIEKFSQLSFVQQKQLLTDILEYEISYYAEFGDYLADGTSWAETMLEKVNSSSTSEELINLVFEDYDLSYSVSNELN